MIRDIKFRPHDSSRSEIDSADGEILMPANLHFLTDGTLGALAAPEAAANIPGQFTALAIHTIGTIKNMIMAAETEPTHQGREVWLYFQNTSEPQPVKICQAKGLANTDEITHAAQHGAYVILATSASIMYLRWSGREYTLETDEELPVIQFGLQKAGHMQSSGEISAKTAEDLPQAMVSKYLEAEKIQISARGYFHTPFLLRYALRMADGTHISPSPPILMLPTVLPPCLGVSITASDEKTIKAQTDFSLIPYHALHYKITRMDPATAAIAIDVYISDAISTFDQEGTMKSHIGTYSEALGSMGGGGTIRGRKPSGSQDTDTRIFEGHYSEASHQYTDHYLSESAKGQTAVVAIPNNNLYDHISKNTSYHLLASLPIEKATVMDEFDILPCASTDFTELKGSPTLDDNLISPQSIIPSALSIINKHLLIGVKSINLPTPTQLPSSSNAESEPKETTIKVYARTAGSVQCAALTYMSPPLAVSFPRYLAYPDSRAFYMCISQGGVKYGMNLTPHPHLNISQWIGQLHTTNPLPIISDQDEPQATDTHDTADISPCLLISEQAKPMTLPRSNIINTGSGIITGICHAHKPPKNGNFGLHNAYCFTMDGVWMLEYDTSRHVYTSAHQINSDKCHNPESITATDIGIAYSTPSGIKVVDGSDTKCISAALEVRPFDIAQLPHSLTILKKAQMEQDALTHDHLYAHSRSLFLEKYSMLLVSAKDKDYIMAYSTAQNTWAVMTKSIGRPIACDTATLTNGYDGTIYTFSEPCMPQNAIIITRPIKCDNRATLESAEVLGQFTGGHVAVAAYGSDLPGHWHLISSSTSHRIITYGQRPYRMICFCVIGELEPQEYIFGIRITTDDK